MRNSTPLLEYLLTLPRGTGRKDFAGRVGVSVGRLNNIAYGLQKCSPPLAVSIELASGGAVSRMQLVEGAERIWPDLAQAA